jgi:hypothetical protein
MRTLLIAYDLVRAETSAEYEKLFEMLKGFSSWARPQYSLWLVKSDMSAAQVRDQLAELLDSADKLLVMDVTGDSAAWKSLHADVSGWIQKQL